MLRSNQELQTEIQDLKKLGVDLKENKIDLGEFDEFTAESFRKSVERTVKAINFLEKIDEEIGTISEQIESGQAKGPFIGWEILHNPESFNLISSSVFSLRIFGYIFPQYEFTAIKQVISNTDLFISVNPDVYHLSDFVKAFPEHENATAQKILANPKLFISIATDLNSMNIFSNIFPDKKALIEKMFNFIHPIANAINETNYQFLSQFDLDLKNKYAHTKFDKTMLTALMKFIKHKIKDNPDPEEKNLNESLSKIFKTVVDIRLQSLQHLCFIHLMQGNKDTKGLPNDLLEKKKSFEKDYQKGPL